MCPRSSSKIADVQGRDFDAALVMGPLYHLVVKEERLTALRQAIDRLRRGGVCLSSLISRYGAIGQIMQAVPDWIESEQHVRSLIENGCEPPEGPKYGFRGYYMTVDEVAPLHEEAGLETIAVVGIEPAISADDKSYNNLQGQRRELWLNLLFKLSREPSLTANSRHLLYIGRKPLE
jgi:SAM-dependent methyltransferase